MVAFVAVVARVAVAALPPILKPAAVPVMLVPTKAEGVPSAGVTSVGLVAKTAEPVPVSSVKAAAKLALEGVARNVATLVPKPLTPVLIGSPVQFVSVPEVGVPKIGVTSVGLVANTAEPVPVSFVSAVSNCNEVNEPNEVALPTEVTAPVKLALVVTVAALPPMLKPAAVPVILVPTNADGVPSAGVTKVGLVANTLAPVPVSSVSAVSSCREVNEPKDVALPVDVTAPVKLALVVTLPAVKPAAVPVMFVPTSAEGVPRAGVTSVGLVANTADPVPVSSVKAPLSCADVNEPSEVAFPVDVTAPVKLAFVVTVAALPPMLKPAAVPVMFVPTKAVGVPSAGVTRVGLVLRTVLPVPVEVVTPVPPFTTAKTPVRLAASVVKKFVASLKTTSFLPAGTVTPVPAAVVLPITVELKIVAVNAVVL